MAISLPNGTARTHANALRTRLDEVKTATASMRIDANSSPVSARFRAWVREAMRTAGLSQKAFAINCKQSESVISEALSGSRQFHAEWIDAQPDAFVEVLAVVMLEGRKRPSPRDLALEHLLEAARLLSQEVA